MVTTYPLDEETRGVPLASIKAVHPFVVVPAVQYAMTGGQ